MKKPSSNHYPRNYGWARSKKWKLRDDVLLEANIATKNPGAVEQVIVGWLAAKHPGSARVDGVQQDCWYEGGGWFHHKFADGISVYLHSSGEDAFDTLEHYANSLVRILEEADAEVRVTWTEHPHRRTHVVGKFCT